MAKLSLEPDRWKHIVEWPFGFSLNDTEHFAEEAKKMARALCSMAKGEARRSLDERIAESPNEGGGWLHKFVKNEPQQSPSIQTKDGYITDPSEILQHHSAAWGVHWKTKDAAAVMEVRNAISDLIKDARLEHKVGTRYTAQEVRSAARRFSNKTSTGIDNWSLKEITLMPDPILESLAGILSDMRDSTVPPLQALVNIMASIPKKDGGSRTVAIASTIYRLLMELDNDQVAAFEAANAYKHDSATAGASAVAAAEDRAMEAELARLSGYCTISILWDLKKFF